MLYLSLIAVLLAAIILGIVMWRPGTQKTSPPPTAVPRPLFAITGPGKGSVPLFSRPLAAAWSSTGEIYVSDTGNSRICVFTKDGRFEREFGTSAGSSKRALLQPAGIDVGPDGTVYVADIRGAAVLVFNAKGSFVRSIHPRVSKKLPSVKWTPTDVTFARDQLFVTDAKGVAVFSVDGRLKRRIDDAGGSTFSYPNGVGVASNGSVVISDTNNGRVVAIAGTDTVVWQVGPDGQTGRIIGLPRGLGVSDNGTVLVADAFLFGVDRIAADGIYMDRYGERGNALGQFQFPNDVDISGGRVLVADKENNRIQVLQWPNLVRQ